MDMKLLKSDYQSEDGKNYYCLVLNLETKESVLIENASCLASAESMAMNHFHLNNNIFTTQLKIFFLGDSINFNRVPKKISKILKMIKTLDKI